MANKFQKSILERLEQEAVRQHQEPKPIKETAKKMTTPPNKKEVANPIEETVEAEPVFRKIIDQPAQPSQTVFTQVFQPTDIGDYLQRQPQRMAKNKTFYLDGDVIEGIKATARAQSVTDSKMVNDILRRVLGL